MRERQETAGDDPTFVEAFGAAIHLTGHRPAIIFEGGSVSYEQLDRESNRLARYLRVLGVSSDGLVGLSLPRGPDLITGMLAVWKAGAAYVPLDPGWPRDRVAYMLADSGAPVAITEAGLQAGLPSADHTVCIDRDRPAIQALSDAPLELRPDLDDRAYVIYTSGSTGRPKGVEITHRAVMNVLEAFRQEPGVTEQDRVLALTTISFDIAVLEIWLPLLVGARMVLAGSGVGADPYALANLLSRHGVTLAQATPATWCLLVESGWTAGRGLRALCGGEPLPRGLAGALMGTGLDLWNVYGPTETTVWSSIWHVEPGDVLIGRPIRRTEMIVLSADGGRVPDGEIGELCIGGAGLARGYLNRPDLTAEKFIPHPTNPGERLYRTGDLGRRRGDGAFEYIGRMDHQVKIDGFRIEPGEIEATLAQHANVRQVVVRAAERAPGDRCLVAYVAHDDAAPPARDELLRLARRWLPHYMVPRHFVMLRKFPLAPSGKIARDALPAPDWWQPAAAIDPPRNAVEARVLDLFREVLAVEEIGVHDDFFDLGGRSRHAATFLARVEREFGRRLPLATLFDAPTVAQFAALLEQREGTRRYRPCLVPIREVGSLAPFYCVHAMGGDVVLYGDLARRLGPDVPVFGLQAVGLDESQPPLRSVVAMARGYVAEVRARRPQGPYYLCGYSFGGVVAFEMAVQLREAGASVGLLALIDTDFPDYSASAFWRSLSRYPFVRTQVYPAVQRARMHVQSLRRLGPGGYARYISQRAQTAVLAEGRDLTKEPEPADEAARFLAVIQRIRDANARALIQYMPRWYDGTITYFLARDASFEQDRRSLWRKVARQVDVCVVPGTHTTVRLEPDVQVLAAQLRDAIIRADQAIPAA